MGTLIRSPNYLTVGYENTRNFRKNMSLDQDSLKKKLTFVAIGIVESVGTYSILSNPIRGFSLLMSIHISPLHMISFSGFEGFSDDCLATI